MSRIERFDAAHADAVSAMCRLDLLTEDEGRRFYRTLVPRELRGFRLYPEPR